MCLPVSQRDTEVSCKHYGITRANFSLESLGHVSTTLATFTRLYSVKKPIRKCCTPFCILLDDFLWLQNRMDWLDCATSRLADSPTETVGPVFSRQAAGGLLLSVRPVKTQSRHVCARDNLVCRPYQALCPSHSTQAHMRCFADCYADRKTMANWTRERSPRSQYRY